MMDKLPLENIHNILSRMSVKSLARFRCVSKQWSKYINDPYFEIMHAKKTSNDAMLIMFHRRPFIIHANDAPCTLSFLEYKYEEAGDNCTLKVRKKPQVLMTFMYQSLNFRYNIILGSCNGLFYSSKYDHRDGNNLVVIHPLRNECYVLPPINSPFCLEHVNRVINADKSTGLGFDESTNTFKMVSITLRRRVESPNVDNIKEDACIKVHVLGTDSWRRIPQVPSYRISPSAGVFANGCLHWLTISGHFDHYQPLFIGTKIISFDVATEEFGLINPPQGRGCYVWQIEQLVDLHGEIGYVYRVGCNIEVWVMMKERGWVMHCEFQHEELVSCGPISILGFWNEYGDILLSDDHQKRMFVYGLNSKSFYQVMFDDWEEGSAVDIRLYQTSLSSTRYSIKRRYATGVL